jgi:hypothetical protein
MAHGHPGYHGYAWYRRAVTVPAGRASWDILGPTLVEDGYELYWNGQLLGGSGTLGPAPRVVGTRPLRFALPADAAGTRGVLAVRAFMRPRSAPSADCGGMHSAPILAPRPISDALHRVQWERTIAGYIVELSQGERRGLPTDDPRPKRHPSCGYCGALASGIFEPHPL